MASQDAHRSDVDLARRVLRREPRAVDEFLDRMACIPAILRMRNRRLGAPLDDGLLQDLAQDVLLAVWDKLDGYAGAAPLEAWTYRFCVNKHLALVRDRGLSRSIERESETPEAAARPRLPSDGASPDVELLHQVLADLEPEAAELIRWRHFEDTPFEEIGTRLNLPPATVKTRYYRALERVRERLERRRTGSIR